MSIFDNAIDSINVGLDDYSSSDSGRLISCTRNLFAGILLLFKHRLYLLSPENTNEALLKKRVIPQFDTSGELIWVGEGKNTVDMHQIKERFDSLGINTHWERIKKIQDFRNNIEHYHSSLSRDAIRSLISNSFIVIRDFFTYELDLDPKEYLGSIAWGILVSESSVYEKEKEECSQIIRSIDWLSESLESALLTFECSSCKSGLISIQIPEKERWDNRFYCRSCDQSWDFEEIVEVAIEKYFRNENYWSAREGDEPSTIFCPECNHETYIFRERYCVLCETSAIHDCQRCGMTIPSSELDGSGYCGWCSHKMSKGE